MKSHCIFNYFIYDIFIYVLKITLVLATVSVIGLPELVAATYYISPSGSDSTGTGSSTTPWQTLVKGMSTMHGGDTLIVMNGTYTGTGNAITHNGTYPPYGTSSAYTTIQAQNNGMAIFDGQTTVNLFDYEANSVNDAYWQFIGLVWCHNTSSNVYMDHITHVKFFQCGAYDCGDGNNINFGGGNSTSYCLFENCYGFGSGRYKFMFYLASNCILRNCVARLDRVSALAPASESEPAANIAIYSCNNCEVQNCISIDTDQTAQYSADEYDGGFLVPATDVSANSINFTNCINLNNTMGCVNTDQNAMSYDVHFTNCVFWANSEPEDSNSLCRIKGTRTLFLNCTFGNLAIASSQTGVSAYPGGRSCSINNSILYSCTGSGTYAADYFVSSDYNAYYANTANYEGNMSAGAHDKTTIDPVGSGSLKYITRIESGSSLSGQGQSGADIGADIMTQYGTSGTLWGDTGYNVDTGIPLWPFPNEALIQSQMQAYTGYGINGARGFCNSSTTLTKYIWQYLGNTIPANIYATVIKAPSNLIATTLSQSSISLVWTDPPIPGAADDPSGVSIESKIGAGGTYVVISTVTAATTTYINTGLSNNTTYYFRARSFSDSTFSSYSNEISAFTSLVSLNAPTNLVASAVSPNQINLSWTSNSDGTESGFNIMRKTGAGSYVQISTTGANVTVFSNTGLTQDTTYYYEVEAYNAGGNSAFSNAASTCTLLNAPSNLIASAASPTDVNLSWTSNSQSLETGFEIMRKTGANGTYVQISTTGVNVTSYADANLTPLTTYYYTVTAYNNIANSVSSNEAFVVMPLLKPPSNLSLVMISTSQVNLSWVDDPGQSGFYIERASSTGGDYVTISSVSADVLQYTDTNLSSSATYYYRVVSFNDGATSNSSNVALAFVSALSVLTPPSNLVATTASPDNIQLNWSVPATNSAASVAVMRKIGPSGSYVVISTIQANADMYMDNGVTPGTTIYYKLKEFNIDNNYAFSNETQIALAYTTQNISLQSITAGQVVIIGPAESKGVIYPDRGDNAQIFFKATAVGKVECTIFTLSGRVVWNNTMDNVQEGSFEWSPQGIASGGYVALVKGPGLNVKKKIAVMR
jgi:hypothetical protein